MSRYKKSFTLIELVVTIGISVILMGAAYPFIWNTAEKEQFNGEADKVKAFIEKAKTFAQNPEDEDAVGYRVVADVSGKFLTLKRIIVNSGNEAEEEIDILNLMSTVKALPVSATCNSRATPSSSSNISFYAPTGEQRCQFDKILQGWPKIKLSGEYEDTLTKTITVSRGQIIE